MQYSEEMLACVQAVAPKNAQITQQGQKWHAVAIGRSNESLLLYNLEQSMWLPDQADTSSQLPSQLARFCMESFEEGRLTDRKRMLTLEQTDDDEVMLYERDLSRAARGEERFFVVRDSTNLFRFFTRYALTVQWAYAGDNLETGYPY